MSLGERAFLVLLNTAGIAKPLVNTKVAGFEVDFHWARLRRIVEVDGTPYARPSAKRVDAARVPRALEGRQRDQARHGEDQAPRGAVASRPRAAGAEDVVGREQQERRHEDPEHREKGEGHAAKTIFGSCRETAEGSDVAS
jgi:hypothetical protein